MKAGPLSCGWEEAPGTRVCRLLVTGSAAAGAVLLNPRAAGAAGALTGAGKPPSAQGRGRSPPRGRRRVPPADTVPGTAPPAAEGHVPPLHGQAGEGKARKACLAAQCVCLPHALAQEASGRRAVSTNTREQSEKRWCREAVTAVWRRRGQSECAAGPDADQACGDSGSGFGGIEPSHWGGKTQKEAKRTETEQRANEVIRSK